MQQVADQGVFTVDRPELYPVVAAELHQARLDLEVTGTVAADVSRNVPVISLASGRVVEIRAHLGDEVTKGEVLMRVESTDVSSAYSDLQQAQADATLAHKALDRAHDLLRHGAIAQQDAELAEDAAAKADATLRAAQTHLQLFGADPDHPSAILAVTAPVAGVITDQEVTGAAAVQALANPSPFTISDLSHVWILCDVFENDLAQVRLGEIADVRLNAYPGRVFPGTIANIGSILDPSLRTAKVRVELANPGVMRVGMFATATFHGSEEKPSVTVPADAVLHLHDRDWVYAPVSGNRFRRIAVEGGAMLPGNRQEILSGLAPGARVVANALELNNAAESR